MNTKYPRQVQIIRNARKAMGYSQQQVATLIGVHVRQYQRIEFGERDIRCASMKLGLAICAVLGIDPLVLVFGGEFKRMNPADEENFEDNAGGETNEEEGEQDIDQFNEVQIDSENH